eukprot:scaffold248223_cov38-Prasinocladus_malaysianus.AAC.1
MRRRLHDFSLAAHLSCFSFAWQAAQSGTSVSTATEAAPDSLSESFVSSANDLTSDNLDAEDLAQLEDKFEQEMVDLACRKKAKGEEERQDGLAGDNEGVVHLPIACQLLV